MMRHNKLKLTTSNKRKIEEFKRFGLEIPIVENAPDLKEVDSDINDVIIFKAIDSGVNNLVEDTVLVIDDEEVVDIRWKIDELRNKPNAKIFWITSLAFVDEHGYLYVYRGEIRCELAKALKDNPDSFVVPDDAFGFDPYLCPVVGGDVLEQSFYDLDKIGRKDDVSPRKMAVESLLDDDFIIRLRANTVPKWTGQYQNS